MSKRISVLVALPLVVALGILGCGGDGPSAPVGDTVAPAAVLDLFVQVVDGPTPSIQLSWDAGTEADLVGYNVYRSANGGTMTSLGVASVSTYVDDSVAQGSTYRYEVSAVDRSGNESPRVTTSAVWVAGPRSGGRGQQHD